MPTLNEVQQKIEARYAKAKASSASCRRASVERSILEVEQATANVEAQSRLSELRAELGLDGGASGRAAAAPRIGAAPRRRCPPSSQAPPPTS